MQPLCRAGYLNSLSPYDVTRPQWVKFVLSITNLVQSGNSKPSFLVKHASLPLFTLCRSSSVIIKFSAKIWTNASPEFKFKLLLYDDVSFSIGEVTSSLCMVAIQAYAELNRSQEAVPFVTSVYNGIQDCPGCVIQLWWVTLTHWGLDKMAAIFRTTFSNKFFWMKMYEFR